MPSPRHCLVLATLVGILLLAGLGASALTDRDEGANAGAAREMLEQGAWISPTLDYVPRFAKPALVYWLMAGAYRILGVGEAAARLPSALAAAALVFAQYAFARWAFGAAVGLRAALVLLLSVEFVALGRMALTDSVLVLWTTAAAFAFFRAHRETDPGGPAGTRPPAGTPDPAPGASRGRQRTWYAAMYVALALAMLTKGPVGVVVPAAGIAAYLGLAGGFRRFRREAGLGWGLLVFLVLAGPWYGAMLWIHGVDYVAQARGETLGRVFRTVTGPGGTALFYVPVLLVGFFPWSAFLPGALWAVLRGARARAAADLGGAATVFAGAWVAAGFALFSLVQSRLPHYVAPLFPFAALLVAATWPGPTPRLARRLGAALGLGLGAAALAARPLGPTLVRLLEPAYPADPHAALPVATFALGALALALGAANLLLDGLALFRALAALAAAFLAVGVHGVLPRFSAEFVAPAAILARRAGAEAGLCDDVVAFGPYRPSLLFYAGRPLTFVDLPDRSRLAEVAARPGRLFVLSPRADLARLPAAIAALPVLDARGGYLLLRSGASLPACTP